ncbi:uncharacterized protein [Diadema antillarum]|uniref:uncharacterized protein n=1 Tax=Diadema antillarum TaxID=105358 RepID=UPI003A88F767
MASVATGSYKISVTVSMVIVLLFCSKVSLCEDSSSVVVDAHLTQKDLDSSLVTHLNQTNISSTLPDHKEDVSKKDHEETGPQPSLQQFPSDTLQDHLQKSIHSPVCVVFSEADSVLEEKVSQLWSKLSTYKPFRAWKLGLYLTKYGPLGDFELPKFLPTLRCYIGTAVPEDYTGSPKLKKLLHWFKHLAQKHQNRLQEASVSELRDAAVDERQLTVVAFPGETHHYKVEWMLLELKETYPENLELFIVHPGSKDEESLKHRFGVRVEPAILVLKKGDQRLRVWQRFEDYQASIQYVEPFVLAQTSKGKSLTVHNFQREVFGQESAPILICFYAHWASDAVLYLETFLGTMTTLQEEGVMLRFGTVDVELEQDIVPRWVRIPEVKGLPFTALFWRNQERGRGRGIQQIAMPQGMPTPPAVGMFLTDNNITLTDRNGGPFHFAVQGTSYDMEVSLGESSLVMPVCITSVNTSIEGRADHWSEGPPTFKPRSSRKKSGGIGKNVSAHQGVDSDTRITGQLQSGELFASRATPQIGSITQVTDTSWPHVIELSHGDMRAEELQALVNAQKNSRRRDKPKTNLVFFIQDGCGSCRRQQAMFERVAKSVESVEGGSAYILNCTSDPLTCARLNVRGFPTLIAFRTFGQHSSERCLSPNHHQHTLRMDYHGVLLEHEIMEWFAEIAVPRVQIRSHEDIQKEQKTTDVILQATVYPITIAGQYLRSVGGTKSWYPLDCFQVACERLYGKARCFAAYAENIKQADRQRISEGTALIISKIEMQRRDGVVSKVITSGRNLIAALQDEADSQIHKFHTPHKYKLRSGQKCEDDHAACTDLITEFVEDHSRLPVTHLTVTSFHAYSSVGFDTKHKNSVFKSGLPVLIALAHRDQMEDGSPFQQALISAAYDLYQDLVFTWVDVEEFPRWVARFVPVHYSKFVLEHENEITEEYRPSLMVYPRLCIVQADDHRHAAFYPPADGFSLTSKLVGRTIGREEITAFARDFLKDPPGMMRETEHF